MYVVTQSSKIGGRYTYLHLNSDGKNGSLLTNTTRAIPSHPCQKRCVFPSLFTCHLYSRADGPGLIGLFS